MDGKNFGPYASVYADYRWQAKQNEIFERDNNQCVICNDGNNLHLHHRQYHYIRRTKQFKAPWEYENNLLVTLCKRCLVKGHSHYQIPTKLI
ncbi:HNH endonuclease [Sphingobacterium sp. Mn56C]|uniref:HNH endonuclease n=1 Tax=Sphingobacterium sp. Mn56C TaxID=3395261 RepID=UPI003BC9A28E